MLEFSNRLYNDLCYICQRWLPQKERHLPQTVCDGCHKNHRKGKLWGTK